MPCPVTSGFFYSLENNANDEVRNTSFEFLADAEGSFPSLRAWAAQEERRDEHTYRSRAQYAVQLILAHLNTLAPNLMTPIFCAPSPEEMLVVLKELEDDITDLVTVSKMKRRADGLNARSLSERILVRDALGGLRKQLEALVEGDYRKVGYGLGDAFRGLHMPSDKALKIGRKLLNIKEGL